jgi:DNA-directed RNA polymerase subunit RPC12/RpoP
MNWLRRMMTGRYGADQLGTFMLVLCLVLSFVPVLPVKIVSWVLILLVLLRMFSKNVYRRRAENDRFLKIWYPIKNWFVRLFRPRPDAKTHKRFRCPKCRQELRVPRGKGKIVVTCPKCGHKMTKRT